MMDLVVSKRKIQPFDGLRASGVWGVLRRFALVLAVLFSLIGASLAGAAGVAPVAAPTVFPSPNEIIAAAPASDWVAIAPSDLLVMDLAADAKGRPRRVVIQLMPAPFSQGWIGNIRKLAAAKWWDGTSVNRVQDNYVVQWGDVTEKKALPVGLVMVGEANYQVTSEVMEGFSTWTDTAYESENVPLAVATVALLDKLDEIDRIAEISIAGTQVARTKDGWHERDSSAEWVEFWKGWPLANIERPAFESNSGKKRTDQHTSLAKQDGRENDLGSRFWPVHCYAMVGVGRNLSPDTGSGAELYTVIGHAPRHLDRNIALVGRVIEGIEHLSSLPRGTEALGFYKTAEERVAIRSTRMGSEVTGLPRYEYLSTESASFAKYADARANRRDPFFIKPAGGADICNIPVPVRRVR